MAGYELSLSKMKYSTNNTDIVVLACECLILSEKFKDRTALLLNSM